MDNKKFEQLIDLIINENEEQARALFHDIVVEKSREIYENMMDEDNMMMNQPSGMVEDLLDEIGSEEAGMSEDEEFDIEDMDDDGEETVDIDMDDEEGEEEDLEDRVVDLEDKLDQLMAEFEEIMGGDDDMGDDDMDDAEGMDDEEGMDDMGDEEEDPMMENITLKNVKVVHGDNGVQNKSTVDANSGQAGMASRPVKFSGGTEANPTGPKGPSNYGSKGETSVKGAGSFKNSPAQNNADLTAAPKPVTKDEAGKVRSPVAESRRTPAKRRI